MKIEKQFTLDRPIEEVWIFFEDVPSVADCVPGAEYLGQGADGKHKGKMSMKVGPFQAAFEGAAEVTYDKAARKVDMTGKGVDKKGASRGKMTMVCTLADEGGKTGVTVDADVQLSGTIAQFGRTGIIQEIAGTLIKDFVSNVEDALPASGSSQSATDPAAKSAAKPKAGARPISGGRLLWISLRSWLRGLVGRSST